MEPGKKAIDEPAPFVPSEMPAILGLQFLRGPMRGNQVHAVLLESVIEAVTVIGPVTNQMLRLGFRHVAVELS